ncbi:MAG TPA: hypothetical protein VJ570_07560 [Holophagaceae bacterium]|nr:hypothetical protein [Holophagaceae bacterium]
MRLALRSALPALAALTLLLACGGSGSGSGSTPTPGGRPKVILYVEAIPTGTSTNYALRAMREDGTADTLLGVKNLNYRIKGIVGDRVVYSVWGIDNDQCYSVKLDGTDEKLLSPNPTIWRNALLQGDHLVMQNLTGELYVVPVDGSRAPALLSLPGEYAGLVRTTPTGVIYRQNIVATDTWELRHRTFDLAGGPSTLTKLFVDGETFRDLAGDRALITTTKGLFSIRFDGTDRKQLAAVQDQMVFCGWSGNQAVVANGNPLSQQLYVVALDAGVAGHALDDTPDTVNQTTLYNIPGMTTDGTRVVYYRLPSDRSSSDLYSAPLNGGLPVRLTSYAEIEYPLAIRNGKVLVARSASSYQGDWDLLWIPLDGSAAPTPVVKTAQREMFVGFAGDRLVFRRLYADREELLSATLEGQDERLLETVGSNRGDTWAWVANDRVYASVEATPGNYDFSSVKADGTGRIALAARPEPETYLGLF